MVLSTTESALLSLLPPPAASSLCVEAACTASTSSLSKPFAQSLFRLEKSSDQLSVGIVFPAPGTYEEVDLLAVGVTLLHAFAQVNWTGPALVLAPLSLFEACEGVTETELNDAAIDALSYCGEPVYHLTQSSVLLLLALQIFGLLPSPFDPTSIPSSPVPSKPYGRETTMESWKIWRLRAGTTWIKVLDDPVPLPPFVPSAASALRLLLPSHSADRAQLSLSLSLLANLLSKTSPHSSAQKEASVLAREAAAEEGLEWELTGRMGKRTKWQLEEKTQLVVLARDRTVQVEKKDEGEEVKEETAVVPEVLQLNDDTLLERTAFTSDTVPTTLEPSTSLPPISSLDPSSQPRISPFSQSILLSLSLSTLPHPTSLLHLSSDVLSTSQIIPFISRVILDPANWSVHSMALLLRCRSEAGRSRTVERGVLQMQALVDQLRDGQRGASSSISAGVIAGDWASARDRLVQFHALALPPAWELEKELAIRYLSLGVSRSALEIFERLEMWEEVARCYISLEQPEKGIKVIEELLEGGREESDLIMEGRKERRRGVGGEKREAKLWCMLGEMEVDAKHYEKAWIVSGKTSSRAQRSLGATHWAANEWDKARVALRLALRINPLFPRTWFVLGCCEMRMEDWTGAQEAFGRCVALEDDDAESWSNLASCHLRRGEKEGDTNGDLDEDDEETAGVDSIGIVGGAKEEDEGDDEGKATTKLPFSRKRAAFHCLKQAIKHSYESWRMWYNYMVVAVDVGEMSEACRALGRIVEMRAGKDGEGSIDLEVLERLVDAVTRDQGDDVLDASGAKPYVDPNVGKGLAPRIYRLINETILPNISSSPRVYLAHARLLLWSSDYAGALDAHLKAYRAGISTDLTVEHDLIKFREGAVRVEEVMGMLENLGPKEVKGGGVVEKEWKFQARSIGRTFLGRTKTFEDEPEYERLKECVKGLRASA